MDHVSAQAWLDRYVDAWRTYDQDAIHALFTSDATYAYRPYGDSVDHGIDEILSSWLENRDDPSSWEASYHAFAVDGDRVVARGWTHYSATEEHTDRRYENCFLMEFDRGRCRSFTEFFMKVT